MLSREHVNIYSTSIDKALFLATKRLEEEFQDLKFQTGFWYSIICMAYSNGFAQCETPNAKVKLQINALSCRCFQLTAKEQLKGTSERDRELNLRLLKENLRGRYVLNVVGKSNKCSTLFISLWSFEEMNKMVVLIERRNHLNEYYY